MSDQSVPLIAAKHPIKTQLEAGKTYFWCGLYCKNSSLMSYRIKSDTDQKP